MSAIKGDQNRNIVAALSYVLFFITGIVILLVEKDNKFIRFHAMQSVIVFGGLFIISIIVGMILSPFRILGFLSNLIDTAISILTFAIWIVSMIKAYQGQIYKWPIAGVLAEKHI